MLESQTPESLRTKIKEAPHWRVVIRPGMFVEERIETLSECWRLVESSGVSLRGWDYPHVDRWDRQNGKDWIESWCEFGRHREYWRFFQSGQFLHLFSFTEDEIRTEAEERARSEIQEMPPDFSPSGYLEVMWTLWTLTEIFEFAARLAQKEVFGESVSIEIQMIDVKDRVLFMWDPGRASSRFDAAGEHTLDKEWSLTTEQLLSESSELALSAAEWFFERFQWMNPPRQVLANDQRRLLERQF